jgi:hypothetical protein
MVAVGILGLRNASPSMSRRRVVASFRLSFLIVPLLTGQSGQPFPAVAIDPAAGGAEDEPVFPGDLRKRDAVFQEGTDDLEAREGARPRLIGQAAQGSGGGFRVR